MSRLDTIHHDDTPAQRYEEYRARLFDSLELNQTERLLAEHWGIAINEWVIARARNGMDGRVVRPERFVAVQKAALALALQAQEAATPLET